MREARSSGIDPAVAKRQEIRERLTQQAKAEHSRPVLQNSSRVLKASLEECQTRTAVDQHTEAVRLSRNRPACHRRGRQ